MAKRKKTKGANASLPMQSSSNGRLSTDISDAENGYIVNVSGETGGKNPSYFSKRYIASDRPEALRIASSCLAGTKGGNKKKSGNKKKIALKRG